MFKQELEALKAKGLTLAACIEAFAVANDDPYIVRAHELVCGGNDVSIDEHTVTSVANDGAHVLAWLWVSSEEAGVAGYPELLETVLDKARKAIGRNGSEVDTVYADWLEDLIGNYADELDEIETVTPKGEPGEIVWVDGEQKRQFRPSDALARLVWLACDAGLPDSKARAVKAFCTQYGTKLDAILTVYHTSKDAQ